MEAFRRLLPGPPAPVSPSGSPPASPRLTAGDLAAELPEPPLADRLETIRVEGYGPMEQLAVVVSRSVELPTDRGLLAAPIDCEGGPGPLDLGLLSLHESGGYLFARYGIAR